MDAPVVGLLTDFGSEDTYVGQMKLVMAQITPEARLIDLCHQVPPQNILSGAYLTTTALPHVPSGGVLLGVVDPGVGSNRRAIAARVDSKFLVGPDNGLFDLIFRDRTPDRVVVLENSEYFRADVSSTFHGRDVFSPVAAHLARGVDIDELGPSVDADDLERLPSTDPFLRDDEFEAHVIHIDRFGNLITNLTRSDFDEWIGDSRPDIRLEDDDRSIELQATFADRPKGRPLAYFGSTNRLEIAVNNGNAERYFGANQGTVVFVSRAE